MYRVLPWFFLLFLFGFSSASLAQQKKSLDEDVQEKSAIQKNIDGPGIPSKKKADHDPPSLKTAQTIVEESDGSLTISFRFPEPKLVSKQLQGTSITEVGLHGAPDHSGKIQEKGKPLLPKFSYLLELPDSKVTASVIQKQKRQISVGILAVHKDRNADNEKTQPGSSANIPVQVYEEPGVFPGSDVRVDRVGKLRDLVIFRLDLYPYRYAAQNGRLEYSEEVTVKISFDKNKKNEFRAVSSKHFDAFAEENILNHKSARKFRKFVSNVSPGPAVEGEIASAGFPAGSSVLQLFIVEDGIYRVSRQYLEEQAGISFSGVNPRTLKLLNLGKEVPVYVSGENDEVFDPGDYIEFFGESYRAAFNPRLNAAERYFDPWTDENVYYLVWGTGLGSRLVEESAALSSTNSFNATTFLNTIHVEDDLLLLRDLQKNVNQPSFTVDYFGMKQGTLVGASSVNQTFELPSPNALVTSNATLKVNFIGISDILDPPGTVDHKILMRMNNALVSTEPFFAWNGQTDTTIEVSFLSSRLHDGLNTFNFEILPADDPNRTVDVVVLNWFDITYEQKLSAVDDMLTLRKPNLTLSDTTAVEYKLTGFSSGNISLYKKNISRMTGYEVKKISDGSWNATFQDLYAENVEYIAVTEDAKLLPKRVLVDNPSNLRTGIHNVEYLVIAHGDFINAVQKLADFRTERGLQSKVVDVQDVYDEFNGGIRSPFAIKKFLQYTFTSPNWNGPNGPPSYVLLVGDAAIQFDDNDNFIPPFHVQTDHHGPTVADHWYSMLTGGESEDIIPDVFLGRLPVATAEEADVVINKIIEYETLPAAGPWKAHATFIGGSFESRGVEAGIDGIPYDVFRLQTNGLIDQFLDERIAAERVFSYPFYDADVGSFVDVVNAFNEGRLLIYYEGHGGGGVWNDPDKSGNPMLSRSEIDLFNDAGGRYPFVFSMTCFVSSFDNTFGKTLGELLLLEPEKGAIGLYGSAGTAWILNDAFMGQEIFDALLERESVGEALLEGKIKYLVFHGNQLDLTAFSGQVGNASVPVSMVYQYMLLGDPALQLATPGPGSIEIDNKTPNHSDVITVSGSTTNFSSGQGQLTVYTSVPVFPVSPVGPKNNPKPDTAAFNANPAFTSVAATKDGLVFSQMFPVTNGVFSVPVDLSLIDTLYEGIATVKLFAENSSGSINFYSSRNFSVNGSYFSDVTTIPEFPTSDDSIAFQISVLDPQGIDSIAVRVFLPHALGPETYFPPVNPVGNGVYRSDKIPPLKFISKGNFQFFIYDSQGNETKTGKYNLRLFPAFDLLTTPGNVFVGGSETVTLNAIIENAGIQSVENVQIDFYDGDPGMGGIFVGSSLVSLPGSIGGLVQAGKDTASVVLNAAGGPHTFFVSIDPDDLLNETNRANNVLLVDLTVDRFNVTPQIGTSLNGSDNDSVFSDTSVYVRMKPGAVSSNTVLTIRKTASVSIQGSDQPDLSFLYLADQPEPVGYEIHLNAASEKLSGSATVSFRYDTTRHGISVLDSAAIYRWNTQNNRWQVVTGQNLTKASGLIAIDVSDPKELGLMTLIRSSDFSGPVIEATIEGQLFVSGGIASRKPKIAAVISDRNGVSLKKEDFVIKADGTDVDPADLAIPDSLQNPNVVTLTYLRQQTFDEGDHTVTLQAKDMNGNVSPETVLDFTVSSDFNIDVFGNFPNPFKTETTLAYSINAVDPLNNFSIRIYTVSGRLIRKITNDTALDPTSPINSVGYHEVNWDALDDDGIGVANGVYLFEISGKLGGKKVSKRGKMMFIR